MNSALEIAVITSIWYIGSVVTAFFLNRFGDFQDDPVIIGIIALVWPILVVTGGFILAVSPLVALAWCLGKITQKREDDLH